MAFCEHCLKEIDEGVLCAECAADNAQRGESSAIVSHSESGAPQFRPQFMAPPAPPVTEEKRFEVPLTVTQLPPALRPLSAWGFLGYGILFAIQPIGFVLALVLALGGTSRVCLKNYARGVLLMWLLATVLSLAFLALLWFAAPHLLRAVFS
ncbi:MAG: hypothetical protein E7552_05305 [Ruminococcaceae bacterium]|nr:hypothetical protein [Oscillospiraceae bacterium]